MKRVILFGGSFDPIHNGHLEVALHALKQTNADALWFVLAALSPFKEDSSSFADRKELVNLAIAPYKKLKLCTIEASLPKPSYSIDTVLALKRMYPDTEFLWLIGSDQIADLPKWKDFETLHTLVEFIVYPRFGYELSSSYRSLQGSPIVVSSTDIRTGKSFAAHPNVLRRMMEKGLYLKTMTKEKMSPNRYAHTLAVSALALELAHHYRLDENAVILASMTHDWAKEMPASELEREMRKLNPKHLDLPPALYHGFVAASLLSKHYYVRNKTVLRAIRGHVSGASTSPLGMVLYIADKCERTRGFDSEPLIEVAKQDLRKGFKLVKEEAKRYRRKDGITNNH